MAKHPRSERPPRTGTFTTAVCHCGDADCPDCAAWWEHDDHEDFDR